MKRILIATPDFPPAAGGIQVLMARLAERISKYRVTVLTIEQDGAARFDATLPYGVIRIPIAGPHRISIAGLNAAIPLVTAKTSPSAIVSGHVVCGPGALVARKAFRTPVLSYVYAMELAVRRQLASIVLPRVDQTIAISEHSLRLAERCGANSSRLSLIHPGVDPPPQASGALGAEPIVLTIARLTNRYKGFDVMLRAMPLVLARVPAARWVVIGDGPLRAELEVNAASLALDGHVVFAGGVSDTERDAWLQQAQVFAMPSRVVAGGAGEGFGIAYLEAGRFGVPSVAGRDGGAVEAVLDGVTGMVVDPRDHVAVADAIASLLLDDERRRRYGRAARDHASRLSWERMARRVEGTIDAVLTR